MSTQKLGIFLITFLPLLLAGCGNFVRQSKTIPLPATTPVEHNPPAFDGTAFLAETHSSGLHPDVTASRWIGRTYSLRFTVIDWMRNGEAVGVGGTHNGVDYYFTVPVEKHVRLGDTVERKAVLKYYFHNRRGNIVWVFSVAK